MAAGMVSQDPTVEMLECRLKEFGLDFVCRDFVTHRQNLA